MVSNTDQPKKNTSQNDPTDSFEEVEDLTLFADESFDTVDIDLFEFTGEEESPLTRLKSIILSLDWEISDDILQELADEIVELQQVWEGDKVAQVYLQGLDKIGRYLRDEGAYAHPNAIKLLLTFFYDFEKIVSSPDMSGEEISNLLKTDVRKFKILQYQISQLEAAGGSEPSEMNGLDKDALSLSGQEPLTRLKATILGLEWEVTDSGLEKFREQVGQLTETIKDDKAVLVLLQGLQALGNYIAEEKADAHPEAFILLHSFYKGVERLLKDETLTDEDRKEILVVQVDRLNNLKALIAASEEISTPEVGREEEEGESVQMALDEQPEKEEDQLDEEALFASLDDEEETQEGEITEDLDNTLMALFEDISEEEDKKEEGEEVVDDLLDPEAIQPIDDDVVDDFIEGEEQEDIPAALEGLEAEEAPEERNTISPQEHIEEQLDLLFSDDSDEDFANLDTKTFEFTSEVSEELELDLEDDLGEKLEDLSAALSLDSEEAQDARKEDKPAEEIDLQLDSVFEEDDETTEEIAPALSSFTGASDEEDGSLDTEARLPADELAKHLDSFFDESDDGEDAEDDRNIEPALSNALDEGESTSDDLVAPALADVEDVDKEEEDLGLDSEAAQRLEERLDQFFNLDVGEQEAKEVEAAETVPEQEDDSLFEDKVVEPALAGEEEVDKSEEDQEDESMVEIEKSLDSLFDQAAEDADNQEAVAVVSEEEELDLSLSEESLEGLEERFDTMIDAAAGKEEAPAPEEELPEIPLDEEEIGPEQSGVEEQPAEEADILAMDDLQPALAAVEPEDVAQAGEEAEPVAALHDAEPPVQEGEEDDEVPTVELEDKLNFFFADQEADGESVDNERPPAEPVVAGSEEERTEHQAPAPQEDNLQALGRAIARFNTTTRDEFVDQTTNIIQIQQEYIKDTTQKVLLTLMNTVVTSIPREYETVPTKGTEELMDYLYQCLKEPASRSDILVEAVTRFTAWHQQLLHTILEQAVQPQEGEDVAAEPATSSAETETAPQPSTQAAAATDRSDEETRLLELMRNEFAEIRSALKEEIETLKKELTS